MVAVLEMNDRTERELWEAGKSAFWLDPDRWHKVPFGMDGRLKPFWMYLHRRPGCSLRFNPETLEVEEVGVQVAVGVNIPDAMPIYRLDDLNRLYLVGWRPWPQ